MIAYLTIVWILFIKNLAQFVAAYENVMNSYFVIIAFKSIHRTFLH